ncbi:MAG: hypothetical protein J5659_05700 [Clostridia bacterium]|nr:hypothetical protein [Clostridia bacterium]
MEENNISAKPEAGVEADTVAAGENQTPKEENEILIPVKFNKEIKELNAKQAATLAQKGMKFEMIEDDYNKLRQMALKGGMSVPQYINELQKKQAEERRTALIAECGGNEALADRVLELEDTKPENDDLDELREYFPTVKSLDDLPRAVVESARLKGENLLNAYLKFRFIKQRQKAQESLFERNASQASVGSLKNPESAADDTFIKALWGK